MNEVQVLNAVERELRQEISRVKPSWAPDLPERPPQQPRETYAPPSYRQPDDEIDPVIKGLLTHLPAAGTVWPAKDRKLWLSLLEGSFQMIFREADLPGVAPSAAPSQQLAEPAAQS